MENLWEVDAEGCPDSSQEDFLIRAEIPGHSSQLTFSSQIEWFMNLWDSLNAKRGHSWESNPWVWVVSFKVIS